MTGATRDEMRREMTALETTLRRAGIIADRQPTHPSLPAWRQLVAAHTRHLERLVAEQEARRA